MESAFRDGSGDDGLKLIETFGWDGAVFSRLDAHLARLAHSAARLGWDCDLAKVQAKLHRPKRAVRVRLTLDATGAFTFEMSAMPPPKSLWRLGLAAIELHSKDPWLTLKSTRRAAYNKARGGLDQALDEVLLQNERGEVCDGTITTVFFDQGDGLCTPPLACGLLPGVLRAELLAKGACREQVLLARDLPHVRLWVGNSLRGLMRAEWAV